MKLVTWNVNSVNARLDRVLHFIDRENPDFLCLQELKCPEENFPLNAFESKGLFCSIWGQKTYNGVAIISKTKPDSVVKGMETLPEDKEARFISAKFGALTVVSAYVPNGQEVGAEKYHYKLNWMEHLSLTLSPLTKSQSPLLVCGDFNVALTERDVHDPHKWQDQILFSEKEKEALQKIIALGLHDIFRQEHPSDPGFTWWDYRNMAFLKNHGLRIDYIFASASLQELVEEIYVDKLERKGNQPSDHAPLISIFKRVPLEK